MLENFLSSELFLTKKKKKKKEMIHVFIVLAFTFHNMVMNQDEKTAFVEKFFTQQMHTEYK